ncbi:CPBP family intramembrane glutamic endopeptidase [Olivibacter sp. XZL3]|uniref:CPBP family intramembrane glutamic endopeptidase n=1 Tax=Olivibacter sp. XZL3 TaxID=1735116 RepID=UPI001065C391|nr:CPBP family intramembrane glutamic endopeptidase [Olivibacter sp. XZL3]
MSFLYLLITVLFSAIVFSLLGLGVGMLIFGSDVMQIGYKGFSNLTEDELNFISVSQIFSATGTFVVPALLLNRIEKNSKPYFTLSFPTDAKLYALIFLLMLALYPFFELTILLNEQMHLPDFMKGIEQWMRRKEDETNVLTHAFLSRQSVAGLFINIFMIGVLAAVGEELLFRGCLQNILIKWIRNPHIAIWLTAVIFSAIHLQFYGFLPRMLIGALCGYLYFFGRSIWLPIFAHFINNASAVLLSFYLTRSGKSLDSFTFQLNEWPWAIVSLLAGLSVLYFYKRQAKLSNN